MMKNTRNFVLFVGLIALVLTGGSCGRRFTQEPWELEPLARGEIEVKRLESRADLLLERVRFYSDVMDAPRFFLSLIPKTDKSPDEVFILNHGWWDRPEDLLSELQVDAVYAEMLARDHIKPALVVLPDVRFDDYFRRNRGKFPFSNYLTLIAEETSEVISKHYGIVFSREKWSIGGFSFGGYLSLDVARRYSGRFGGVSVISSFYDEDWSFWPTSPPDPGNLDDKGRGKHRVVEPGPIPQVMLACGTDDRMFDAMKALHELLTRRGIEHMWLVGPGGHTWEYWASVLEPMFEFHLAAE